MQTRRSAGFAALILGALAAPLVLPGCDGGASNSPPTVSPEVKVEHPKDASGKTFAPSDEKSGPIPTK